MEAFDPRVIEISQLRGLNNGVALVNRQISFDGIFKNLVHENFFQSKYHNKIAKNFSFNIFIFVAITHYSFV